MKRLTCLAGSFVCAAALVWMAQARPAAAQAGAGTGAAYHVRVLPLPDNNAGNISMDYIAYDPATNSVWVPAGNTGAVDVVDAGTDAVRQIPNLPTSTLKTSRGTRVLGPSGVSVAPGVVYIGNRGDSSVCAYDAHTLARIACGKLDSMPDGVAYVAPTHEVWVTTPRDNSMRILDARTLEQKAKMTYSGNPEGYAVDAKRGRFYTNLESKDRTLAIDLHTHQTLATWNPACGEDGPHGLSLDEAAGHLYIACSTRAEVMNVGGSGAILSKVETGDGVDDLHYVPASHLLYVGAARAAKLTIARADSRGHLSVVAQVPTRDGARNPTVSRDGTVFLAHGGGSKLSGLVVVTPPGAQRPR